MNKELIEVLESINKQLTEARRNTEDNAVRTGLIQAESIVTNEIFKHFKMYENKLINEIKTKY